MVDARLETDRSNPAFLCFVSTSAKAVNCNAENAAVEDCRDVHELERVDHLTLAYHGLGEPQPGDHQNGKHEHDDGQVVLHQIQQLFLLLFVESGDIQKDSADNDQQGDDGDDRGL